MIFSLSNQVKFTIHLTRKVMLSFLTAYFCSTIIFSSNTHADLYEAKVSYYMGDFEAARQEWEELAQNGNLAALVELGRFYAHGIGVKKDTKYAKKLLLEAAGKGAKNAYLFIAKLVEPEKYDFWQNKGVEAGDKSAQRSLADSYRYGISVSTDLKKAFYWYLKSAKNGDSISQGTVAWMYASGKGVPKNLSEAYKWQYIVVQCKGPVSRLERQQALEIMEETLGSDQVVQIKREAEVWLKKHKPCPAPDKSFMQEIQNRLKIEKITLDQWKKFYAEILSIPSVNINIGIGNFLIEIPGEPMVYKFSTLQNSAHPAVLKWQENQQSGEAVVTGHYAGSWIWYLWWKYKNS